MEDEKTPAEKLTVMLQKDIKREKGIQVLQVRGFVPTGLTDQSMSFTSCQI